MIPSSEALSENIRKHCEGLAKEIARRCVDTLGHTTQGHNISHHVEAHAMSVLLDWFLGDFIPNQPKQTNEPKP